MKVKNVNPFEKHVEKIVLALAVLGAAYLGYSAFTDPVKVERPDGGDPLTAEEVEPAIGVAVNDLQSQMQKNIGQPLNAHVENFVAAYEKLDKTPLPTELLARVPVIEPLQPAPSGYVSQPNRQTNPEAIAVAIPVIPPPKNLTGEVSRGTVLVGEADKQAPVDKEWVTLKADYPMKALNAVIHNARRLPPENQRVTFYRVAVSRAEQKGDGSWGDWQSISPAKSVELPPDELSAFKGAPAATPGIVTALAKLDEAYLNILHPPFYPPAPSAAVAPDAVAPTVITPAPAPVAPRIGMRPPANIGSGPIPGANIGSGPIPGPGIGSGPIPNPNIGSGPIPTANVGSGPVMGGVGSGPIIGGPGGVDVGAAPAGKEAVLQEDSFPIWFYDENITPGAHYKYRMSLRVYNPTFRLADRLAVESKRNEPYLDSDWVYIGTPIHVEANRHFYIGHGFGGRDKAASVVFYQWEKGRWYTNEQNVLPGQEVGKEATVRDQKVNFATGYTVVDVENGPSATRVVLMDPSGQLVVRDSAADSNDPVRRKLDKDINDAAKAVPSGTAMAPGAGGGN